MTKIFQLGCVIIAAVVCLFIGRSYDPVPKFYGRSGQIMQNMKVWTDTIAVTSANPTISISSAGFSQIVSVQPQIIQGSASLSTFMWCNVTSYTTSGVTLFLTQENSNTVTILTSTVLLGTPLQQPSSFSNVYLALQVIGY